MSIKTAHLSARSVLNRHAPLVTIVSLVIMLITANNILGQLRTANAATALPSYFYDVATDSVFVSGSQDLPPITGPGSKHSDELTAVRAFVFACNDCAKENDRFVAWVEAYTPDAKDAYKAQSELWKGDFSQPLSQTGQLHSYSKTIGQGHMIAKPDPQNPSWKDKFVQYESSAGNKIRNTWPKRCGAELPRQCFP
jgi:hypothetical protein